jgi:hypothetical protein
MDLRARLNEWCPLSFLERKSVNCEHCDMPLNHCKIIIFLPLLLMLTLTVSCVLFNGARMSRIRVDLSDLHISPWISERYVTGCAKLFVSVQTQDQHCDRPSRLGSINFLVGVMELANAQRTLYLLPSSCLSQSIVQTEFSICQWGIGLFYLRNRLITLYVLICLHVLVCPDSHPVG